MKNGSNPGVSRFVGPPQKLTNSRSRKGQKGFLFGTVKSEAGKRAARDGVRVF
jgi:hypothetical protein